MSHLVKVFQAWKTHKAVKRYKRTRKSSYRMTKKGKRTYRGYDSLFARIVKWLMKSCCIVFCPGLVKLHRKYRDRDVSTFWGRMFITGTFETEFLKGIVGFTFGMVVIWCVFLFYIYELRIPSEGVTRVCMWLGAFYCLGLAFSTTIRMMTLLLLPQIFSVKGRALLLAYLVVLTMNGPVQNTIHNTNVMTESLLCGKDLIVKTAKELLGTSLSPLRSLKNGIKKVVDYIRNFTIKIRLAFLSLQAVFEEVGASIRHFFRWLAYLPEICNERMGRPYENCMKAFDVAIVDCREKLGVMKFLCEIVSGTQPLCKIAKIGEFLCLIPHYIKIYIIDNLKKFIRNLVRKIKNFFYVRIQFTHDYSYNLTQTKTLKDVAKEIMKDIHDRLEWVYYLAELSNTFMVFSVASFIYSAHKYKKKYLTIEEFDNHYITFRMRDIDKKRFELGRETLFPLKFREKAKYIKTFSLRMKKKEFRNLVNSLLTIAIAAVQIGYYMALDYGLYWILKMIQTHAEFKTKADVPARLKVSVKGDGLLAKMFRSIIRAFNPLSDEAPVIDTSPCLPRPLKPNFNRYMLIVFGFILCIIFAFLEPFGMRMRHVICSLYYPEREQLRAVWLYNRILRMRFGFLTYIRRRLRRRTKRDDTVEDVTFIDRILLAYPGFNRCLKSIGVNIEKKMCIVCGQMGKKSDMDFFKHCPNLECKGVYCVECFKDMKYVCTMCMQPMDYGDLSDISIERDSSEDESRRRAGRDLPKLDYSYQYREFAYTTSSEEDEEERTGERSRRRRKRDCDYVTMEIFDLIAEDLEWSETETESEEETNDDDDDDDNINGEFEPLFP